MVQTVLVFLANSSHLDLVGVNPQPAEQAAGLPIRSIDLKSDNPGGMQTVLSGLPLSYQPTSSVALSNGAIRLVWPIVAEPLPGLK